MARYFFAIWCSSTIWSVSALLVYGAEPERLSVFAIDIESRKVVQVASEPLPGHAYCGSPEWSLDGRRVVLDATPGRQWSKTRVLVTDYPATEQKAFMDLGPGNCPTWSPEGKRIAFLLNSGAVPEAQPGIWIMNADGTDRVRLADGSLPKWSPDGKQILSVSFSNPTTLTLLDAVTGNSQPVTLADHKFFSVPSWAGDGDTIVAVVRANGPASIALVDVSNPAKAAIKQVLWTRGAALNDEPIYPVYSAKAKRCVFIGRSAAGFALYRIDEETRGVPMRLEPDFQDSRIASLTMSADGEKVLFCSERGQDNSPRNERP